MVETNESVLCQCTDKSQCEIMTERIRQCMFAEWYPKIAPSKLTYKSLVIPLSNRFVELFLKADGMFQPENQPEVAQLPQDSQERTEYMAEAASVREQITNCLTNDFTTGCLVKMNWSSTIDAEFISQTLECNTADEVFL